MAAFAEGPARELAMMSTVKTWSAVEVDLRLAKTACTSLPSDGFIEVRFCGEFIVELAHFGASPSSSGAMATKSHGTCEVSTMTCGSPAFAGGAVAIVARARTATAAKSAVRVLIKQTSALGK